MELEQLRHFIRIAELGSFSRAAAALNVTQPFLSRQIGKLETELHKYLFFRHGRGVSLTEAGQLLLGTARSVIYQIDHVTQDALLERDELMGTFVLGITTALSQSVTIPVVRRFTSEFSAAKISIVEGLSRELNERLLAGKLDAAFLHDQPSSSLVHVEHLSTEVMYLLTSRESAEARREVFPFCELARLPLIFPSMPHSIRSSLEAQAIRQSMALNIAFEIDGVDTMLSMVCAGIGHTVATADVARAGRYAEILQAIPIVSPTMRIALSLATPIRNPRTLLHRLTLNIIRETFTELHKKNVSGTNGIHV